mmetsp:Transcript_8618/g.14856  ORF Transcript_8618/g.14856 Transcript_8618/m.14856 type:complete len:231 (-) Transcript_8618:422-1114(-)
MSKQSDYVPPKEKRGWAQGTVGWGVQGTFGGDERDVGEHSKLKKGNLVKDERGRWVKPSKDLADDFEERLYNKAKDEEPTQVQEAQTTRSEPYSSDSKQNAKSSTRRHSRSRSRSHSPRRPSARRSRDQSRSNSRDRSHRHRSRSRDLSRDRSKSRRDGSHRSRDRSRERPRSHSQRHRSDHRRRSESPPKQNTSTGVDTGASVSGEKTKINPKTGKRMRFTEFGWENID